MLIGYIGEGLLIRSITKDLIERRRKYSRNAQKWNALACKAFGIKVIMKNAPPPGAPGLVIGNHIGIIDVMALASQMPPLYVTSEEMHETPVLGLLTEMGGCLYVERRNRGNIMHELGEMVNYLKKGFRVVIYPEATSHNGEEILPFKRTLLTAAAHAGVPIRPYVFNVIDVGGEDFNLGNRDSVCWYGDIPFHKTVWNSFGLKYIVVEFEFLPEVHTRVEDDRAEVADRLRDSIVEKFRPARRI